MQDFSRGNSSCLFVVASMKSTGYSRCLLCSRWRPVVIGVPKLHLHSCFAVVKPNRESKRRTPPSRRCFTRLAAALVGNRFYCRTAVSVVGVTVWKRVRKMRAVTSSYSEHALFDSGNGACLLYSQPLHPPPHHQPYLHACRVLLAN